MKLMDFLNYENGLEYMFQFLRPKEFAIYATLNKFTLSLVQKYFVVEKMLSLKTDGYSTILDIPKHTLFNITLSRNSHPLLSHPSGKGWDAPATFIFRPISVKNYEIFGWIISGNGMLKTGRKIQAISLAFAHIVCLIILWKRVPFANSPCPNAPP